MIKNLNLISKAISEVINEAKITASEMDFDTCYKIYNSSNVIRDILSKSIVTPITEDEIENINDDLIKTFIDIYVNEENIYVESEFDKEYDDKNEPLDAYSLFIRDIRPYKLFTKEEEIEVFKRIENGDKEAVDEAVLHNQRLIISIAKKFVEEKYDLLSAIQDGNLGIIRAIQDFDYRKGYKFSTYATWWIRQAIGREKANNSDMIRRPIHLYDATIKYNRLVTRYESNGEKLNDIEAAKQLNCSEEKIISIRRAAITPISLNSPVGEDEDDELGNLVVDENSISVENQVFNTTLREDLYNALDCLTKREREIIIKRFGLETGIARTLEDVAKDYHITRERIRQIEAKALRKLRHPSRSRVLKEYLLK